MIRSGKVKARDLHFCKNKKMANEENMTFLS